MFSVVPVSKTTGIGALLPILSIASGRFVDTYSGTISLGAVAASAGIAFAAARTERQNHSRKTLMVPSSIMIRFVPNMQGLGNGR